jgi:hypothetical protein
VLRRRCQCGNKIPTLLILGGYRMTAMCTTCGRQMSDETGRFSELVLPLLGGQSAGKTRPDGRDDHGPGRGQERSRCLDQAGR